MVGKVLSYIFHGKICHALENKSSPVFLQNAVLGIDNEGKLVFLEDAVSLENILTKYNFPSENVITLGPRQFLLPGFIDAHIHAPQYSIVGTGYDLPLLDWLETYTYPAETRISDREFSNKVYNQVVRRTLTEGTTTACYYATIHLESTLDLCDIIDRVGQRAYVGKVNMDSNLSPETYRETATSSLQHTKEFITRLKGKKLKNVKPIITPRFAPSCTIKLLEGLGELAEAHPEIPIQTHISENPDELTLVKKLFPGSDDYVSVYEKYGLISSKTLLGHGIYLTDRELEVLKRKRATVVHCPNSNLSLVSGFLDVRRLLDAGVNVCLGTDVSGGSSYSMIDCIKRALDTTRVHKILRKGEEKKSYK